MILLSMPRTFSLHHTLKVITAPSLWMEYHIRLLITIAIVCVTVITSHQITHYYLNHPSIPQTHRPTPNANQNEENSQKKRSENTTITNLMIWITKRCVRVPAEFVFITYPLCTHILHFILVQDSNQTTKGGRQTYHSLFLFFFFIFFL